MSSHTGNTLQGKSATEEIFHGNQEESREEEKETLTVARGRYLAWALSEFQKASREKHLLRGFFSWTDGSPVVGSWSNAH
jgi:hypothetical protein